MLGQRPLWQQQCDPFPEGPVVAVAEPGGAVDGLELDEGQKGCWGCVAEQMVDDDEVEGVVHSLVPTRRLTPSQAEV